MPSIGKSGDSVAQFELHPCMAGLCLADADELVSIIFVLLIIIMCNKNKMCQC